MANMSRIFISLFVLPMVALRRLLYSLFRLFLPLSVVIPADVNRANRLAKAGEFDEAISVLDRLMEWNRQNPALYALRGTMFVMKLKHDSAVADFNTAITLNAAFSEAYSMRGLAWTILNEHERAADDFTIAIELEREARLGVESGNVHVHEDVGIHPEAMSGQHRGAADAASVFDLAVDGSLYTMRANAYGNMGMHLKAMDDHERAIAGRPEAYAYAARGEAYFSLGIFDDALKDFNSATRRDPSLDYPFVMRGNVHLKRNDPERAEKEYSRAIALTAETADVDALDYLDPGSKALMFEGKTHTIGNAYCGRGMAKSLMEDIAGAFSDFDAATRLVPDNAGYYMVRADCYGRQGNWKEAMRDLEVASDLDDKWADVHWMKASVLLKSGERNQALQEAHRAADLSPYWDEAYSMRGRVLMCLGEYGGAITDLERSIGLRPGNSNERHPLEAHVLSSRASMTTGRGRPAAYVCRGLAYLLNGDEPIGKESIAMAAELGCDQSDIEEEISRLDCDESDRKALEVIVRTTLDAVRAEREASLRETVSKFPSPARPADVMDSEEPSMPGGLTSLRKEAYTELFERLGFRDVRLGRTLKHQQPIPSIAFRSRYGIVYFLGYAKDRERYRPDLWRLVAPRRNQDAQDNRITLVPTAGREREAFENLLIGDSAYEDALKLGELHGPSTRVMVNDYRQRKSRDTVGGRAVNGVIHLESCRFVPEDPGRWWMGFNSLKGAQMVFGEQAATCGFCLKGEGRHRDRVQST